MTIRIARDGDCDIQKFLAEMDSKFHTSARLLENSLYMAQYHISADVAVSRLW